VNRPPKPDPGPTPPDVAAIVRRARRLRFRFDPGALAALSGAYLGARPGTGLTFSELRGYEPGDDVRHLDWNVTARQGKPYVRIYVEERALTLRLIVDVSASMRFGPDAASKADRAMQAAALLATAAIRNGDRAGLTLVSDQVELDLPPSGGARQLARLTRALVASPSSSKRTDLASGLTTLAGSARRALVVVLGDFLEPGPEAPWRRAARRHRVVAFRLVDPRERALPDAGLIATADAETGRRRVIDSGSRRVRSAFAAAAIEREAGFRRWLGATGIVGADIPTDDDPVAPLVRFFRGRPAHRRRIKL